MSPARPPSPASPGAGEPGMGAEEAIAACGGDAHAAVRALLAMIGHLRAEITERDAEIAALAACISRGYARGRGERVVMRPGA